MEDCKLVNEAHCDITSHTHGQLQNDNNSLQTNSNNNINNNNTKLEPAVIFSRHRNRWYTNEEVACILTSFSSHPEWQTNELQKRPKSGAVLLYSREKVRYRQDGYCWKKRKNGRTTREDHMKLKVQGVECIYGCYVHSAILPTFHRRCYWLLENPDTVLVHYLNQPPDDQGKSMLTLDTSSLESDTRRSWTEREIIEEIGSVFGGISEIHHTLSINFPAPTLDIMNHGSHDGGQEDEHMLESTSPQTIKKEHSFEPNDDFNLSNSQSALATAVAATTAATAASSSGRDDFGSNIVDSMDHVDELRDLMMSIGPSDAESQQANLLVDTNSLDLFSFKPSTGDHKQQLDVKSTTSDTDTMNRLSPLTPIVPRCNSTDNAMLIAHQSHLDQFEHQTHNFVQNSPRDNLVISPFSDYNPHLTSQQSANTEPSHSTSCSPSPSSSSLMTGNNSTTTNRFAYLDGSSGYSTSNSYMKLPLQQRQKSEQKEPCNSVLSSLLPKALSLDGSDLSVSSHRFRRGTCSPLIGVHNVSRASDCTTQQPNLFNNTSAHHVSSNNNQLLLPPESLDDQSSSPSSLIGAGASAGASTQHQQPLQLFDTRSSIRRLSQMHQSSYNYQHQQRPSEPTLSPHAISLDASNDILVNQANDLYRSGSMFATNFCTQQQQQQQQQQLQTSVEATTSALHVNSKLQTPFTTISTSLLPILDYAPSWSVSSGGTKVLLIGNWTSLLSPSDSSASDESRFLVSFNDWLVPASLIEDHVLKCYSPPCEPGYVNLRILFNHSFVTEQVSFEIRAASALDQIGLTATVTDCVTSAGHNPSLANQQQHQQQQQHQRQPTNVLTTADANSKCCRM